jgi:hypothetical protein
LVRLSVPLLARPGRVLQMAGRDPGVLDGLHPPPDALFSHPLTVPFLDGERHLVDIRYD